jgi:hypothetical protein
VCALVVKAARAAQVVCVEGQGVDAVAVTRERANNLCPRLVCGRTGASIFITSSECTTMKRSVLLATPPSIAHTLMSRSRPPV